jgi:hypothetical protein
MKIDLLGLALVTTLWLASVPGRCQNLADIASTSHRDADVKRSSRVYTNADLLQYKDPTESGEQRKEFQPTSVTGKS